MEDERDWGDCGEQNNWRLGNWPAGVQLYT